LIEVGFSGVSMSEQAQVVVCRQRVLVDEITSGRRRQPAARSGPATLLGELLGRIEEARDRGERIEDELRKRGANYIQGGLFRDFAVRDGRLTPANSSTQAPRSPNWSSLRSESDEQRGIAGAL
jgi:hypothetical protein